MPVLNPSLVISELSETGSFVERAQAGDTEAFGEVCRLYETRLLRQAMTLCGNESIAEDLAQDTLVEAWKSLGRYNGRCQFFTWLCAILLNRYRNTVRKKRPLPLSSLAARDEEQVENRLEKVADQSCLPDQAAELREESEAVLACIQALPRNHQQIIYLRFYVDNSLEAIAAAVGCSVGTVKSRLFRALDKLRTMNALQSANVEGRVGML